MGPQVSPAGEGGARREQRDRCGDAGRANDGARAPCLEQLAPRSDARGPLREVVPCRDRHRLDPPGVRREPGQQLRVRAPAVGVEEPRRVAPQRLPQRDQPQRHEARHGVREARKGGEQARRPAAREAQRSRGLPPLLDQFRDHEVGPGLEALHHLVHRVGRMHEVRVQRDGAIALGAVGALQRQGEQLGEAGGVAAALLMGDERHGQHLGVGLEHRACVVRGAVVQHEQLVLARKGGEDLTYFPEHQPGRAGFVVHRDADVDHGPAI